jgi:hypothetical protein
MFYYSLGHTRPESLMIDLALPGQRWEVEFMSDGTIEIERYESLAGVEDNHRIAEPRADTASSAPPFRWESAATGDCDD